MTELTSERPILGRRLTVSLEIQNDRLSELKASSIFKRMTPDGTSLPVKMALQLLSQRLLFA